METFGNDKNKQHLSMDLSVQGDSADYVSPF